MVDNNGFSTPRFKGFEPFFDGGSKLLVLGSFPGVKSRENNFFYGNRLNRFWPMLGEFFGEKADSIEDKKAVLTRHGIALWDIVAECEISGSLDGNIRNYAVADLYRILGKAKIKKILVNGGKAFEIFCRHYPELADTALKMPSTSPANTRFDKKVWVEELGKVCGDTN